MSPALLSMKDVTELLGVSESTAHRLARREDFPAPYEVTAGGRVWDRAKVEKWKKAHASELGRGRGRPRKSG